VTLPRRRERGLLAILLLDAGRVVPMDRLCALLWDDDPPEQARQAVRTHVARIRAVLAKAGAGRHDVALTAVRGNYMLAAPPDTVDAHRFRALLARATGMVDPAVRDGLLNEALALWRGPALADAGTDRLRQRMCADLDELHQQAVEGSLATRLDLGYDPLPDLARLTAEHPHRGRLTELHMLALYRQGRTKEALDVYERTRLRLAADLGLDPGPALQRMHRAILRGEPPPPAGPIVLAQPTAGLVPAQLPADVSGFVGRDDQLRLLDAVLPDPGADGAGTVGIATIAGTAGVGKTALAVRWAHRVRDRFPDGQLYLDLRGYAADAPLRPLEALSWLLQALGVPAERVPADLPAAAGLYRTRLAGKRMLIVLDNARSAEQVRPLLPAAAGCLVVVTSRDRISGLIARDGAHRIALDVLPGPDAVGLLGEIVGPERITAEPAATAALADLCDRLPLALRIVAAHLIDRPGLPVARLVDELRTGNLLSALAADDEQTAVRTAFDLSYQALPAEGQRLFRLLGMVAGPDVTAEAAAALTATTADDAQRQLHRLAGAHLLSEASPGRYTCHDLLRRYAAERAFLDDDVARREAAMDRLHQFYVHGVDAAVDTVAIRMLRMPRPAATHGLTTPRFDHSEQALAWLDAERPNLVAAATTAAARGQHSAAWLLADALRGYLTHRSLIVDWLTVAAAALDAASTAGDLQAQAAAELSLCVARIRQDRHRQGAHHAARARQYAHATGWLAGECAARNNLALIAVRIGALAEAVDHLTWVLDAASNPDNTVSRLAPLQNLGTVHFDRGDLATALDLYQEAAAFGEKTAALAGRTLGQALIGRAYHALGRPDEARAHLDQARSTAQRLADSWAECITSGWLAQLDRDTGHPGRALHLARAALAVLNDSEAGEHQSDILNIIGTIHQRLGQRPEAADHHRRALDMARLAEARRPEIEALLGLATAHLDGGRPDLARPFAEQALALARNGGYRVLEAEALAALAAAADPDETQQATDYARTALAIHEQTGYRLGQANTHLLLSHILHGAGQSDDARQHRHDAHAIYTAIGAPDPTT
jgi:DNA-binding SARP family transcriptional activator/tetratricopeptide (TPR) repeat protein